MLWLPGVNSAAILVNSAYLSIFFTLLFVYLYMCGHKKISLILLISMVFADDSFAVLYISLFFYGLFNKDKKLLSISFFLFLGSMYLYGFDTGGKPKGYFLDALGVYATVFSIPIFIYLIYALYRIMIKEEKSLLWYISFFTLTISLILSMRQKLPLENFVPFVVIAIPLGVKVFLNSYRVRLPKHRRYHNLLLFIVLFFLVVNLSVSYINKPLYYLLKIPKNHLAYKYHIAKELAEELKTRGIKNINLKDKQLALRLKFYGIEDGGKDELSHSFFKKNSFEAIEIKYYGKIIKSFYIYKQGSR